MVSPITPFASTDLRTSMRHLSPGVREKTAACFSALGPQQTTTSWAPGEDSSELSQFRRPEIPNQGVGRAVRPPKAPVEDPSYLFQLLGAPGIPGLVAASLPSLPPSLSGFSPCLFLFWSLNSDGLTSRSVCAQLLSHIRPTLCNPLQAPLSMGFSRQEYWSGLPFPPPISRSFTYLHLQAPFLQTRSHSQVPGAMSFGGLPFNPPQAPALIQRGRTHLEPFISPDHTCHPCSVNSSMWTRFGCSRPRERERDYQRETQARPLGPPDRMTATVANTEWAQLLSF